MAIEGALLQKIPAFNGTGLKGNWVKQEFILETRESTYAKKVCISVFGEDRVRDLETMSTGDSVKASVNIESREFKGRWYTEVRAWRLEKMLAAAAVPVDYPVSAPITTDQDEGEDDLPF